MLTKTLEKMENMFRRPRTGNFRPPAQFPALSEYDRETLARFAELYYRQWMLGRGTIDIGWLGYKTLKCPLDLWTYQEIIVELGIDLIVECGTRFGGSAYFFACLFDMLGKGRVVTVDIGDPGSTDVDGTERPPPIHPRIEYVTGSSTAPAIVERITADIRPSDKVMVILDSDHRREHVLAELRAYAPLVSIESYLIVEDTNINGHPVLPEFGPGPWEAVETFVAENSDFIADEARERFLLTLNPRGYLWKISNDRSPIR